MTAFLKESVNAVASTLSEVYPEMENMKKDIAEILAVEVERYLDATRMDLKDDTGFLSSLLLMDFPSLGRIKKYDLEKVKAAGVLDGVQAFKW